MLRIEVVVMLKVYLKNILKLLNDNSIKFVFYEVMYFIGLDL